MSSDSPRNWSDSEVTSDATSQAVEECGVCYSQAFGVAVTGSDKVLVSLTSSLHSCEKVAPCGLNADATVTVSKQDVTICAQPMEHLHTENATKVGSLAERSFYALGNQTKLTSQAPAFQPVLADTRMDAVVKAISLVLASSGQTNSIKVENGVRGESSTVITAELQAGPNANKRCYDVMQCAKQSLDAITTRLGTVSLLSARVQKEDRGYSLRSSIACLPETQGDRMCWDMFKKGYCPRRSQCRWYHPEGSDIGKFKISIKYTNELRGESSQQKCEAGSSAGRYKLSLGELV
jgi:hypothetical protein